MSMPLPKNWVEKNCAEAKGTLFMGRNLTELSRDELIAVVHYTGKREQEARIEHDRRMNFSRDLRRPA